jgi:hypothetical protein
LIKQDIVKWIGVYKQILKVNKSDTNAADILKKARELYYTENKNNINFAFEHCWVLVKDHSKWNDGWNVVKPSKLKEKARSSN